MSSTHRTPSDQPVRDRIVSDFDHNFLVEAGAGSGKTYSLAMRMAAGIERGAYRVEEMAAVTFTRKAAAELRGRFQLALEERLRTSAGRRGAASGSRRRSAGSSGCSPGPSTPSARTCCASGRWTRGWRRASRSSATSRTCALRKHAWRDFVAEARASGRRGRCSTCSTPASGRRTSTTRSPPSASTRTSSSTWGAATRRTRRRCGEAWTRSGQS